MMVKYDGFAGGIEFGGLRSILDIKILVCYIKARLLNLVISILIKKKQDLHQH